MRQFLGTKAMRVGLCSILLLTMGGLVGAPQAARTPKALTAAQATACIQTAVAAQDGVIAKVEVEEKGGKRLCDVRIVDQAGKKHTQQVATTTNQVVKAK